MVAAAPGSDEGTVAAPAGLSAAAAVAVVAADLGGEAGGVPWGLVCFKRIREGCFNPEALMATPLVSATAVVAVAGLLRCSCCSATVFLRGRWPSCT